MIKNPFRYFSDRRRKQREERRQQQAAHEQMLSLAVVFESLDLFAEHQFIHLTSPKRNVAQILVSNSLASDFMQDTATWQQFLHNLHNWARFRHMQQYYSDNYTRALADAEAAAYRRKGSALTQDERQQARFDAALHYDEQRPDAPQVAYTIMVIGLADSKPIMVATLNPKTGDFDCQNVNDDNE